MNRVIGSSRILSAIPTSQCVSALQCDGANITRNGGSRHVCKKKQCVYS